ncbi:nucleoporin Nup120/160-domain-containing protein [Irpex rosettiformis]|uniref:Nucleoporin Nup120/160-domain-containing protein n=1 Tax=Irpex rosettiformis TaxID=378272 RepID=A0ACB8UE56_9APHY|nr:nucleoporin Nup120/160-domain-containing protein [Irpex rosettiformis]
METSVLVAAQISSLFPSTHALNVGVKTRRPHNNDNLQSSSDSEQAIYSEIFNSDFTGSILLRVIHDGHILELISLSTDAPPLRFIFPDPVIPNPAVMVGPDQELHVIAVTTTGSLFRIVVPVPDVAPLWQSSIIPSISIREYLVNKWKADSKRILSHVQSIYSVTLANADGSVLRLDAEQLGQDDDDDQWSEHLLYRGSFLNSLSSFLHSSVPGGSTIISVASHPPPTDIGHFWTLSRDRTIRLWNPVGGCILEKVLSALPTTRGMAAGGSPHPNLTKTTTLLHEAPQRLLRVFKPDWSEFHHLLVFVPTEYSPISGGYFSLFNTTNEQLALVAEFECSSHTVHSQLQDFIATPHWIYTLWDKAGQSMVDRLPISNKIGEGVWLDASYPPESELTPAYLDELLLSPGSLADKFFEAIMRPGMFSSYTLQTALTQYIAACGSLPWPTDPRLSQQYATTAEAIASVVGCTVQLSKNPQTGALLYDNYWNALKRDWEGFVARCREIERSARWPLAIGIADPQGEIIVVERERIASLVREDLALRLHRTLSQPKHEPMDPQFSLLDILWTLRTKLGPRAVLATEMRVVDIVRQEIAFPYADIIQDTALRLDLGSQVDDGFDSWLVGRLQSVENIEDAVHGILDIIGGFEKDVKREEEEVELLLPAVNEELSAALTASYATLSVNARYDLALALIMLLFFLPDVVPQWDPSRLAEVFVVFRGVALLRFTARQPAGPAKPHSMDIGAEDDIVIRMRSMNVATGRAQHEPSYSLLHRLLTQFGTQSGLPTAAHRFIDATGLLQSLSPAHATRFEVVFCERLRVLGYREASRELLTWLPRTPAMNYVLLRVWLDESRYEDAAAALETLGGSFGTDFKLLQEDSEALAAVLPGAELFDSQFGFYLHAAALFKAGSATTYEVLFSQHAISTAPIDVNTSALWQVVIRGFIELGLYDDAYGALMSTPYEKLKRDCVATLVQKMCEEHAVDRLMSYNFAGVVDEVEASLSFKARNADPQVRPFYSKILYTWYIARGDYRNAASTMYQRARRFGALAQSPSEGYMRLAQLQLEAYAISINSLSLIDQKSAWFVLPVTTESVYEPRKRRKLSKHIPESSYTGGTRDAEVIELNDIQYEYALLVAQIELVQNDPRLLASIELLRSPSGVVSKLAQLSKFDLAIATAKSLGVDMSELFTLLTTQCLRLARNPDLALEEPSSDWLLTDKVSSWPGTATDRAWRYLRQTLERHDGAQSSFSYSKITLETILSLDRSSQSSPWLISLLEDEHPEYLIRTYLRYEVLDSALECTLSMVRKVYLIHIPLYP